MFDTLITHARILDGTGSPWYRADVGIVEGRIAAIGDLSRLEARRTIDATGLVLSPGFIEVHGHSDATLLINPRAESSIHQGVTTECNRELRKQPLSRHRPQPGPGDEPLHLVRGRLRGGLEGSYGPREAVRGSRGLGERGAPGGPQHG